IGIGATVVAMWWVTGRLGFVPEHPETLEPVFLATNSGRMESLTFTAPMAYALDWLIYYSDANKVMTLGVASVAGVVAGAFVHAVWSRTFRWEGFAGTRDTALHLVGALCMGVGGVTAMGCTVGQGLSGVSTLSVTSLIALAAIIAGAWLGFRFQLWLLERE
ncbi:MAG: YeeE/YedE thiosulfate transporter family protein, partial [Tepidimonas taiwanensis]|nr:YeeE/YedE thiosulfate transporter family protein [Tepidimonas taiwanensis]